MPLGERWLPSPSKNEGIPNELSGGAATVTLEGSREKPVIEPTTRERLPHSGQGVKSIEAGPSSGDPQTGQSHVVSLDFGPGTRNEISTSSPAPNHASL